MAGDTEDHAGIYLLIVKFSPIIERAQAGVLDIHALGE